MRVADRRATLTGRKKPVLPVQWSRYLRQLMSLRSRQHLVVEAVARQKLVLFLGKLRWRFSIQGNPRATPDPSDANDPVQ